MSETTPGGLNIDELPIFVHTRVLGVDIGVSQRKIHQHVAGGKRPDSDIEIVAYGDDRDAAIRSRCHKDIAAWARRNLFDGAGGSDTR